MAEEYLSCSVGPRIYTGKFNSTFSIVEDKFCVKARKEEEAESVRWPGRPERLQYHMMDGRHFRLTWGPPADASVEYLHGFVLEMYVDADDNVLFPDPVCYIINWTGNQTTLDQHGPLPQNARFSIDCHVIQSRVLAVSVILITLPVPRSPDHTALTSLDITLPEADVELSTHQTRTPALPELSEQTAAGNIETEGDRKLAVFLLAAGLPGAVLVVAIILLVAVIRRRRQRWRGYGSTYKAAGGQTESPVTLAFSGRGRGYGHPNTVPESQASPPAADKRLPLDDTMLRTNLEQHQEVRTEGVSEPPFRRTNSDITYSIDKTLSDRRSGRDNRGDSGQTELPENTIPGNDERHLSSNLLTSKQLNNKFSDTYGKQIDVNVNTGLPPHIRHIFDHYNNS
ncbi:uncharacterized protein LOC128218002 [Mya arenaria]|uniref:uncharacterized protein LOC128218002 n=1 Tax=Mya arenaria TaxID=6604 RepID=UPI0022E8218A|nr:uncharacterized protein LOC128218002 [Mya arenaria]